MDYLYQNLKFINISGACPEQYKVFDENNKQVGYIRLRWGYVTVRVPDYKGDIIFDEFLGEDGWQGCFTDERQRKLYLDKIAKKINEWISSLN